MNNMLFKFEKISSAVTRITGITKEHLYLVEGTERAALIDTGVGVGNIRRYVESLTSKPLIVILTHGHLDHASGSPLFGNVYLNEKDWNLVREHCTLENRQAYVKMTIGEQADLVKPQDYIPYTNKTYLPLQHGDIFDLGSISLEVFPAVGHTQGSVCVLIRDERAMILGDFCTPFTFMFAEECSTIEDYLGHLLEFKKIEDTFDTIYLNHGPGTAPKSMVHNVIETARTILAGQGDDIEFHFMNMPPAYIAHKMGSKGQRADGKIGNIVYNKARVFTTPLEI